MMDDEGSRAECAGAFGRSRERRPSDGGAAQSRPRRMNSRQRRRDVRLRGRLVHRVSMCTGAGVRMVQERMNSPLERREVRLRGLARAAIPPVCTLPGSGQWIPAHSRSCRLFPIPYSLFPIPCSLSPIPYPLFPIPCPYSPQFTPRSPPRPPPRPTGRRTGNPDCTRQAPPRDARPWRRQSYARPGARRTRCRRACRR
jgi:hypothetical protein